MKNILVAVDFSKQSECALQVTSSSLVMGTTGRDIKVNISHAEWNVLAVLTEALPDRQR